MFHAAKRGEQRDNVDIFEQQMVDTALYAFVCVLNFT